MPRGLDHIVHAVRDLDAAAELYRRLGFTVGARNRHPRAWGTQNHIVQMPGTFIELLALADGSGIVPHSPRQFSFGAFNRDFLERRQGLSMLVLEGRGAPDAEAFRAAGIGDFELYEFEREAKRSDGTPLKVSFALAFASDSLAPETGFFTCQHRHPENFWNPAFQQHANGVENVAGVVAVAEQPSRHRDFLLAFTGAASAHDTGDGFTIDLPRGAIELITPAAFERRFGLPAPDASRRARLAVLRFSGRALAAGRQSTMGAVLLFEPACGGNAR
jgi:catechol 2,3-dioxygenase-like lactoylglutathione lyase family enzyme